MSTNGQKNSQLMTGAAQTMLTWSRVINSIDEMPEIYHANFQEIRKEQIDFPYIVLNPALKNQRNKPTERLLILIDQTLYVLEKRGKKVIQDHMLLHPQIDLEMGNALLYSWMTFRDLTETHETHKITITFNAATVRHLEPILFKVRKITSMLNEKATLPNQQAVLLADFKFNHFAKESLPANADVRSSLWQPTILKQIFKIFGRVFYQHITLAHNLFLTDQELIIIWDDEQSVENRGVRYGGIRRFIPLSMISSMSVENANQQYCTLVIQLIGTETIEHLFAIVQIDQLHAFVKAYQG
ncbi:MAG: hypothetical protein JEZ00_06160 [Anaerolineaceae bacterium]|nr:hypothetical protein [Anaerolineaceae bacterium]